MAPFVRWFDQLSRSDLECAGGKGANLGEMTQAGLPVPPGFVVTVDAYRRFLVTSGIANEIADRLAHLNVDDAAQLQDTAKSLQNLVRQATVPDDVKRSITQSYEQLAQRQGEKRPEVAVRSSATVEDTAEYSFAGMFESFLNVRGDDELVARVKDCWASLYGARVLFYRVKQGFHAEPLIAVIIQIMVNADKSGVLFTVDPANNNPDVLVIEAAWGLGEVVVSGAVTPDWYAIDKETLALVGKKVARKDFMLVPDPTSGQTTRVNLPDEKATAQVLTDPEIHALAELGLRDEGHYHSPQDAEWAIAQGKIYLVQTRPITTLSRKAVPEPRVTQRRVLVRGLGASPGVATGTVRVLTSPREAGKLHAGEILVAPATSPDWVPAMRRAAAIVTNSGGMTSHAAIVSRELGIPCIVGARDATELLQTGMLVTVDAGEGTVREGALLVPKPAPSRPTAEVSTTPLPPAPPVTATRLYVNLAEPDLAETVAKRPVDGVGLLRAEFMLLSSLDNTHPHLFLQEGRGDEFVARMAEGLRRFAKAFSPRPVIYRTMDFRTNEFRGLRGGDQFEPVEQNPMIGFRGCYRYVKEPELFLLELAAVKEVRDDFPNLQVMIPFVRTAWEFRACKELIDQSGLTKDRHFQLWIMAEVPSVVWFLEEYAQLGVQGVSIGSNDLTQLVLGVDRDNPLLAPLFDERDKAVLETIRTIIERCHALGLTASICGQAPSVHPEYAEALVRWGIDSISVNSDVIEATRRNIAAAEQRIVLAQARSELPPPAPESQLPSLPPSEGRRAA